MKAKATKPAKKRKWATELETIRAQYYEENRQLRSEVFRINTEKRKLIEQVQLLKEINVDEQVNKNCLLMVIKSLKPPKYADTSEGVPK